MARERILVVEDDNQIQELVRYNLVKDGYQVDRVSSGEEALQAVRVNCPDLIVLDLMLPGIDGWEVCRRLKREGATQDIPLLMVTARGEETDIVTGLELGADDYLPKPFSPRVLLARIRAILRRVTQKPVAENAPLKLHEIAIHPGRHEVLVDDASISLTPTEFRILFFLAGRPGWVFTRYQIAEAVHGGDTLVTDRSVDVQMVGLRKKLGHAGRHLETVRGVGYRFKE